MGLVLFQVSSVNPGGVCYNQMSSDLYWMLVLGFQLQKCGRFDKLRFPYLDQVMFTQIKMSAV